MFHKLQNKFLLAFTSSIMVALIVTIIVIYSHTQAAYLQINEKVTQAENDHISSEIQRTMNEIDKSLNGDLLISASFKKLISYDRLSDLDRIYAIQEVTKNIGSLLANNRYADSVYIFYDDLYLAFSNANARRFYYSQEGKPSGTIMDHIRQATQTLQVIGGVKSGDFPLAMTEGTYLMVYKKVVTTSGSVIVGVNLAEKTLSSCYEGVTGDGLRTIRILDNTNRIISSVDKSEIGLVYDHPEAEQFEVIRKTSSNTPSIITSVPIPSLGLILVSSIPTEVYRGELISIRNTCIIVFVICMIFFSILIYYWIDRRLQPVYALKKSMKMVGHGDYNCKLTVSGDDEVSELTEGFNTMLDNLEDLRIKKEEAADELREAELTALRNEINPHFLYNTLNMLKCMADIEGVRDISKNIVALGSIVATLYKSREPFWTLMEEIKLSRDYIKIMNSRYGDQIIYETEVCEDYILYLSPKLILQPILENSIIHGFSEHSFKGRIALTVQKNPETIEILIDDDGTGLDQGKLDEINRSLVSGTELAGIGINNVNKRIKLRCGEEYGLSVEISPLGGLRTIIQLPILEELQ